MHAAVADLEPLVENRLQPFEVLHPGLARIGRGQVQVDLHDEVRREAEAVMLRQGADLQEGRDAADPRRIGLKKVRAARLDQPQVLLDARQHLACRDRRRQRSEEHTSELQSLMRISYAVFCLKKKNQNETPT